MSTALDERTEVTSEELELVKRTVANGATDAELKLYLHYCARQGVHPLDRLIHFTKREGKYTPITSIDFMRTRAADTGEYAGSDDAVFGNHTQSHPDSASVTVWRLVQGQRCPFTATARWAEYCPDHGPSGKADRMWKRMPHTMLAKCAEALALRKGFPRQLAGLYAREEMDQAGEPSGYSVTPQGQGAPPTLALPAGTPSAPNGAETSGRLLSHGYEANQHGEELPVDGQVYIARVDITDTRNANVKRATVTLSDGRQFNTIKTQLQSLCEQLCAEAAPVVVGEGDFKVTKWGNDLLAIHRADAVQAPAEDVPPLTDEDIPFGWLLPFVAAVGGYLA